MKGRYLVLLLLVLWILPLGQSPNLITPTTEGPVDTFIASADGDESSESITSFSETLADDTFFYPDQFDNDTSETAVTGIFTGDGEINDWTATQVKDATEWSGDLRNDDYELVFEGLSNIDGFDYALYADDDQGTPELQVYDFDATTWVKIDDLDAGAFAWYNGTLYNSDYWNSTYHIRLKVDCSALDQASLDYCEVEYYFMALADSEHYAESFADVEDWEEYSCEADDEVTSDDDVASFASHNDGNADIWQTPIGSGIIGQYVEIRHSYNASGIGSAVSLVGRTAQLGGGSNTFSVAITHIGYTDTYSTVRQYIGDDFSGTTYIYLYFAQKSVDYQLDVDYIRIGPATETGWQHDGSITEGITTVGDTTVSTDGDLLNVSIASGQSYFYIETDTTTTKAKIEPDYHLFLHIHYSASSIGAKVAIYSYDGSSTHTLQSDAFLTKQDYYYNLKEWGNDIVRFYFYVFSGYQPYYIDYLKVYSIANYTVTQGSNTVTDYLYVESTNLIAAGSISSYIDVQYDPALAVDTSTYTVWNISVSSASYWFRFSHYVGGWIDETTAETRGGLPSGTLTTFKIRFYDDPVSVSAVKFIEDGTAPTVVRTNANPPEPSDDEAVTLSSVVTDTVEVHTVKFNAITSPSGFSDVDYSATEATDNLWTYTFSAGNLPNGYYCFKVIASDGANENGLTTEQEFVDFTVRESEIVVEEITLIGAGDDFTMMQFSARINKDCSYTIYEESENNPETDTHSGTVSAPSFNLAWSKLSTSDKNVNFTIKFVNGSLVYNYTSQYQIAQNTFYVVNYEDNGAEAATTVTVTGRITRTASYVIYIDDVQDSTGSITSLDFDITFTKSGADESWHDWAIKFTNGSQTCWANGTYYRWKNSPDRPEQGGYPDPNARAAFEVATWTLIVLFGFAAYVVWNASGVKGGNYS